jgi:hypothetical protein
VPVTATRITAGRPAVSGGGILITAQVCVGRSGPYRFVVDTGTSRSIVDTGLAAALHLQSAGTVALGGSGCATTGGLVKVPGLSVGHIVIAPQKMVSESLADWSGTSVDGVLGSDVLGRFGAVKLDLVHNTLTVADVEGPAPSSHALINGKSGTLPPPSLLPGKAAIDVPLTVVQSPGTIAAFTDVMVANHGPYAFVVDTGSPFSVINKTVAFTQHLAANGTDIAPGGVGCTGEMPVVHSTAVALASDSQSLSSLRSIPITGILRTGIIGTLGMDFLHTYGTIVVDYRGADLALASG